MLVLRSCPELRELEFPGMRQLTSATLVAIMQRTPSLSALNLRGCVNIATGFADAAAAVGLSEHHEIQHLDLSHVEVVDDDVVALLDRLPCLESAGELLHALTDAVLDALPTTIQRVEALDVSDSPGSDGGVAAGARPDAAAVRRHGDPSSDRTRTGVRHGAVAHANADELSRGGDA